jgi:hypothetical protein
MKPQVGRKKHPNSAFGGKKMRAMHFRAHELLRRSRFQAQSGIVI